MTPTPGATATGKSTVDSKTTADSLPTGATTADSRAADPTAVDSTATAEAASTGAPRTAQAMPVQTTATASTGEQKEPVGLEVGLGFASAYLWRGANLFRTERQGDQHPLVAPSVTLRLLDGQAFIGYWGAYQLAGAGRSELIDVGTGAEQDFLLGWSTPLRDDLTAAVGFTAYLYPLAERQAAGTRMPTYLEPSVGLRWAGPLDAGLTVSYYHGVQQALAAYRYFYFNPTIGKTVPLFPRVQLGGQLGFGYKQFTDGNGEDNRFDLALGVTAPVALGGTWSLTPGVQGAWTNYRALDVPDELAWAATINLGVSL